MNDQLPPVVSPAEEVKDPIEQIPLSTYTKAFVHALQAIQPKVIPHEVNKITVSQTVSFFAIMYERVRNAVEFREDHLIRRAAIERILKRRLALHPDGKSTGEDLIRELLWARYLPNNSMTESDVQKVQTIINNYLTLRKIVLAGRDKEKRVQLTRFITDLMTCEIEEELTPEATETKAAYLHYFYQVLKNKIEIKDVKESDKDAYFYVASELTYAKNDLPYIRFHLYKLSNKQIYTMNEKEIETFASKFTEIVHTIDRTIENPYKEKLVKFARKQVPPFLILFLVAQRYKKDLEKILGNADELWQKVDMICREQYQLTGKKVRTAAVRSIIYIFLTKAIFVLILEYPVSKYLYGEVNYVPLAINTLFPPILMGMIVSFVSTPGDKNTKKIYERIKEILAHDPSKQTIRNLITNKDQTRRPVLIFGFTIFYLLTFGITFAGMYYILNKLEFHLVSKLIFMFFISVVAFFSFRITQTAKEYSIDEKIGVLTPLFDFFFIPIISVGKFLSSEIGKLNVFILLFDFLIEAPFKLIFEIVEEWINFVKDRKEDII